MGAPDTHDTGNLSAKFWLQALRIFQVISMNETNDDTDTDRHSELSITSLPMVPP